MRPARPAQPMSHHGCEVAIEAKTSEHAQDSAGSIALGGGEDGPRLGLPWHTPPASSGCILSVYRKRA
jgi:hypothetical protein